MIQETLAKEKKDKSTRKVLVVDDEVKFCDLLKKIFQKNNFLVETAYDVWEAGKKAADSRTEKIKVITISGDLRYSESEVLEAGANSFFTKPLNFEILLSLCNDFVHLLESQK
jgi:DNA-binding response OmpR family regulator